jgi:hypothetical protein
MHIMLIIIIFIVIVIIISVIKERVIVISFHGSYCVSTALCPRAK